MVLIMGRKTKIIVSIGPASNDINIILSMIKAGADGIRLNFAHGTHEDKLQTIKSVRTIENKLGVKIPIIGDLQGPTIRIGEVIEPFIVKKGQEVSIKLSSSSKGEGVIPLPIKKVYESLDEGDMIVLGGGAITCQVYKVMHNEIKLLVLNDGVIKSRMTFVIKNKDVDLPALTKKDLNDIMFCIKNNVDYIALSYVRKAEDIKLLRDYLEDKNAEDIWIIAKIETRSAVNNIKEIARYADAILIARGDLGMYFPLEKIPLMQKRIVEISLEEGKPSILATQLLESMVEKPIPTRAEIVDVMNAVMQGVDSLLLADETAIGKYPVESVKWLAKIICEAEEEARKRKIERGYSKDKILTGSPYDRLVAGLAFLAELINAKIVAFTRTGTTARRISKFRPFTQIYIGTPYIRRARQLMIYWGVKPFYIAESDPEKAFSSMKRILINLGEMGYGDLIVYLAGMRPKATDIARIEVIRE